MDTNKKNLMVRQSNNLIEASYKIGSVGEQRLIKMLIAQIQPFDEDFKTYRISVADFAKFFGLASSSNSVYELIKKAADELAGRKILLEQGRSWIRMNWLSFARYIDGSGYVELRFDKELKPYLLQLQTHWKHYALDNIINFRSSYSIRIFELLKVDEFKANSNGYFKRSFEYEELRMILGIEDTEYSLFADFRVNVVQIAIKEINANPDIRIIQVDYPKTGRKVSHIVFHCEKAKQTQLDVDEPEPRLEEVRTARSTGYDGWCETLPTPKP
jgi:plasmid replication initiation protein